MPAAREATTRCERTWRVCRFPLPAFRSRARSTPPIARWRTPGTAAMSAAASTPRALSIAEIEGVPGARSATHATSSADSTFGMRMPYAAPATAARSASHSAVRAALTRTQAMCSARVSATRRRAASFASGGTASSRSRRRRRRRPGRAAWGCARVRTGSCGPSDDSRLTQLGHVVAVQSEQLRVDLVAVLPELASREADCPRGVPEPEHEVLHLQLAEVLVAHRGDRLALLHVRIVDELLDVVDRRERGAGFFERGDHLVEVPGGDPFLDGTVEQFRPAASFPGRGEPRLLRDVREADQPHHPLGDR